MLGAAVLAGAQSFAAAGEWVADAPPQVLAALGVRRDPLTRRFQPPSESAIRRALVAVDPAALEAGTWLSARVAAVQRQARAGARRRAALAVDGKALRGTRHSSPGGQAAHPLAVLDQQACAVLARAGVDGKSNECVWRGGHRGDMKWCCDTGALRVRNEFGAGSAGPGIVAASTNPRFG